MHYWCLAFKTSCTILVWRNDKKQNVKIYHVSLKQLRINTGPMLLEYSHIPVSPAYKLLHSPINRQCLPLGLYRKLSVSFLKFVGISTNHMSLKCIVCYTEFTVALYIYIYIYIIHCSCWTLLKYTLCKPNPSPRRNMSQMVTMSHTLLPPDCDCVTVYVACHSPLSVMFSLNAVITLTTTGICSTSLSQHLANCLVRGELDGLINGKLSQEKQETTDYMKIYILMHLQNDYL